MRRAAAIIVGVVAGTAFAVGWFLDPAKEATLVVSLVCGTASAYFQLSIRDFLGRCQLLVDRGADTAMEDGGQLLEQGRAARERVAALARTALVAAALAPALATARTIHESPFLSGSAFAAAAASITLALLLDSASRAFARLVEDERVRRIHEEKLKQAAKERVKGESVEEMLSNNPNLARYVSSHADAEFDK